MTQARADGAAGERKAAAILGIATCAETTSTTLSEDAAKVDIKLSFRHAFQPNKLLTVHAQVKSGRSYRASSSNSGTLTLDIDQATITALSGSAVPGMLVWVPPAPLDRLYWYASDPRRPLKTPAKLSRQQYVRPSIRFDLTRLCTYASWDKSFPRQTVGEFSDTVVIDRAKAAYATLKSGTWHHPLLGLVGVTRMAWRHVTRQSRTKARRILALRSVPYLKSFLEKAPSRYVCNQGPITIKGRETIDERYLLCWYRGALKIDGENYTLLLRIKEEIKYPTNWHRYPLSIDDISQNATLASWWCKKES